MSNQRSTILFIALVIILFYLYYESIQTKAHRETKEKLLIESSSSNRVQKDGPKVLFGRQLLSYSTENTSEVPSNKEILSHSTNSLKFRTLNTFPDIGHKNKLKRIKRNARNKKGIYKWKFNVSVSKIDNEFTKPTDDFKNLVDENKIEEESLNVEIYIDGKTKEFKRLEHSWHAVKDSLRNFYKEPNEPRGKGVWFNTRDFSTQTSPVGMKESVIKENELFTSSEDSSSPFVQKGSETSVQEETKKSNKSSRGREAKLLFLNFGGSGNKENPPFVPEHGGNMVTKGTPTESMHDLSFFNSTEQFDIKIEGGVFSSTLLPEHQELDLPLAESNLSLTTKSEPKLDSKIKIAKHNTLIPAVSSEILNCDDCAVQEIKGSIELQTVADDRKTDETNVEQTNLPIDIIDISPGSIQMFCINFVQRLRKSPRFEGEFADIGSGRLDTDKNMEILKVTDIGSGSLNAGDKIESLSVTTQTATTIKTSQQQLGFLQRVWNRLPNFRSRNQRKVVNEDLDISGFPMDFSVQDCKDLFTNQIKINTLQTILEETTVTETKSTSLLFSPNSLISENESSSKSNLDFIRKTDALKVDEITSMVTPDLFAKYQNKPLTTESTSDVYQSVPSFHDQIFTIDEPNMVGIVSTEQTESIGNLNKITLAEELPLKIEDSVEQPKVSKSSIMDLITTSTTASPWNENITDLNTESFISLNMQQSQNIITSDISKDLAIITSKHVNKEDKRFFSDLNNDDILELGSSDERILSDNVTTMDKIELKAATFDQKTSISQRRFIPNFFSEGSGARELPESYISTDVSLNTNEISLSETTFKSVYDGLFLEDEDSFKKTVDFMETSTTDKGRRFIPNFFSGGSGARDLPEFYISTDSLNTSEISLSETSFKSVSDKQFIELSEKEIFRNDILINNHNEFSSLKPFDIGSEERKLGEIEVSTKTRDLNISSYSDNVSFPEFIISSSDTDDLMDDKIMTNILHKIKTDPPEISVHREAFINEIGSGEFLTQSQNDSGQDLIFRSSGDRREISEISFNDTVFTSDQLCTNCTDNLNFPDDCDTCDYFEEREIPDSNVTNGTAFILPSNVSHSAICNDCEELNDDKFSPASEYFITTQKPCINCSNYSIEITKSEDDNTLLITAEESLSENKHPNKKAMVTHAVIPYSQETENSSFSKSNKNDPRVFALLLGNEVDTRNKDQVYFEPEPEISVQPFKPTQPSRGARLNDVLSPDIPNFSTKPKTTKNVSSNSDKNEFTVVDLMGGEVDKFNIDYMKSKQEPEIFSKPLAPRRGARFDDSPPVVPGFTSKSETTVSVVQMSVRSTPSVNSFQSRRGARRHDFFDLEKLDSVTTESISKETTESGTLGTLEEAANTLTETKIERALNHTLIVEDRENDLSTDPSETLEAFSSATSESFTSLLSEHSSVTNSIQSASSTETIQSMEINLNPELKLPSLKYCESASECNVSLNERCMPNNDSLICNCGKAFRRNLQTKECEATITMQTSITIPGERFHEDLRNKDTKLYQQKKMDYIKIMWFLLKHDPKLFRTVAEVDITSFEEGSLIVKYTMKLLDSGNETTSKFVQLLEEDFNKIINNQELLKNASISIYVVNPCLSNDTNYCHKNALCIPTEEKGFKCQCKADYLDISLDKRYPGENCSERCDSNYCGNHGMCYVQDNEEKKCWCDEWYLGERCEIYGLAVFIACFAFVCFLVIAVVGLVVSCKKNRNRNFYNRNMTNFQPGQAHQAGHPRTADALVMDEVAPHCRMSKFLAVSTPVYEGPNPIIQVTSPSFTGSSIDYDSTFDRSPYNSESSKNENGTTETSKNKNGTTETSRNGIEMV